MSRFKRITAAVLLATALVGTTAATAPTAAVASGGPRICC
jgi:hypothetical protein